MKERVREQKKQKETELQSVLKKLTTEKYALVNQELQSAEEYIRQQYMKLLCTIVWYENVPTESQNLYLSRIISGLAIEGDLEEYMRQSLDISQTDLREFLCYIENGGLRYYFVLDGLILAGMTHVSEVNREYLAQLIELCGVTKKELRQLCIIAKSVIQQDAVLFDKAKEQHNEKILCLDFSPYIQNYYAGAIIDTDEEKFYSAPEKEQSEGILFQRDFRALRKVTFHNLKIDMNCDIFLKNCQQVCFKDCDITGGDHRIKLFSCGNVFFENCRFSDFSNRVLLEEENRNVMIRGCSFTDCMFLYSRDSSDWKEEGGVIHTGNSQNNGVNFIDDCVFKNCGGRNKKNYYSSAFISDARNRVSGSVFYNCWHYNAKQKDPEDRRRTMFPPDTPGENNRFYGCANFCYDTIKPGVFDIVVAE